MTNQEQQAQTTTRGAQGKSGNAPTTATTASAPTATKIELATAQSPPTGEHQHHQTAPNCCASCLMPIKDRFIFNVINQNFHQDCVRCADCSVGLNEKCFTQDGKLYCRVDYWRRFGPKCSACSESIKPTEFVQKLKQDLIYHLSCFVCQDCKRHLQAGEQLHLLDDKKILCKQDYLSSHQQSQNQTQANETTTTNHQAATSTLAVADHHHQHHHHHQQQQQQHHHHHHNHQGIKPSPAAGKINAQSATQRHNFNNQENSYQHEELATRNGSGCDSQLARGAQSERAHNNQGAGVNGIVVSSLVEEHSAGGGGPPASAAGQQDEPDEDDADELDEDGTSSLGADGDQFQTGAGNAGGPNYPGRGQQKGSANALKFDPVDCNDDLVDANGKRRGPRTTIKPKQLETLRRAFESAPKPSRHIREQLAAETGLNMRVIQVWFQNRRSKERRMRNSNGSARRNFFRSSSRRLRVGGPQALATQTGTAGAQAAASGASSLIAGKERPATGKLPKGAQASTCAAAQQQQQQQQSSPPLDTSCGNKSNQSPSEFGGSSTGGSGGGTATGFTYFSDSSNQGNETPFGALASLAGGSAPAAANQQQYSQGSNSNGILQQQSPPESVGGSLTPTGGANSAAAAANGLVSLESPSGGGSQHPNGPAVNGKGAGASQQQQQYQSSPMKNTPPPIYQQQQQQQQQQPQSQLLNHQHHLIGAPHHMMHMNNSQHQQHQHQQHPQHHHHHHHLHHAHHGHQMGVLPGHQMMQPAPGMMGPGGGLSTGLMPAHPAQAGPPSVVQW